MTVSWKNKQTKIKQTNKKKPIKNKVYGCENFCLWIQSTTSGKGVLDKQRPGWFILVTDKKNQRESNKGGRIKQPHCHEGEYNARRIEAYDWDDEIQGALCGNH